MFERLGIHQYAYLSSTDPWDSMNDANTSQHNVDAEIEAMQRHGIKILAWYFWINTNDPATVPRIRYALDSFKRHNIHPDIWVTNSFAYEPRTPEDWAPYVPKGFQMPQTEKEYNALSDSGRRTVERAARRVEKGNLPKNSKERARRITMEAMRIKALVDLAAPYGCKVDIYNHRGWFGMVENELAILHRLNEIGIDNVGMVYNFSHSRDDRHDDSRDFKNLWEKIEPHVVAVNVSGLSGRENVVYPSQGDRELAMMKTIQDSGWRGPVGLLVLWKPDDTEAVLRNSLTGVDWIAAELTQAGSGGPRPLLLN